MKKQPNTHLDQIFNNIIYQNKFIKSIQRPLQSLAAIRTVLALIMDIAIFYTKALIPVQTPTDSSNTNRFSFRVMWEKVPMICSHRNFSTLAHCKHILPRTKETTSKPLCGNKDWFRGDVQPAGQGHVAPGLLTVNASGPVVLHCHLPVSSSSFASVRHSAFRPLSLSGAHQLQLSRDQLLL